MVDACVIARDPQGSEDDTLDLTTGERTPAGLTTIYSHDIGGHPHPTDPDGGICMFAPGTAETVPGADTGTLLDTFVLSIPFDAPALKPGDIARITACANDADSVDKVLVIRSVHSTTFAAMRRATAVEQVRSRR